MARVGDARGPRPGCEARIAGRGRVRSSASAAPRFAPGWLRGEVYSSVVGKLQLGNVDAREDGREKNVRDRGEEVLVDDYERCRGQTRGCVRPSPSRLPVGCAAFIPTATVWWVPRECCARRAPARGRRSPPRMGRQASVRGSLAPEGRSRRWRDVLGVSCEFVTIVRIVGR